jgi:hypothetical protein
MSAGRYWMRLSRFLTTVLMWVLRLSQIRMTEACSWWCAAAIRPTRIGARRPSPRSFNPRLPDGWMP